MMQGYAAYKESGVDWLGEIPVGWNVKKLKHYGQMYAGLTGKSGSDFSKECQAGFSPFVPFTSIANGNIVKQSRQFVRVGSFEKQNTVSHGDILFLMSSETIEDIGKNSMFLGDSEKPFLNSFCKGFRRFGSELQSDFVNYLLQSDLYRVYFAKVARGFTRINLKQEFILNADILLPPLPKQSAITEFLDNKTAKIDELVKIKRRQIELLAERKQILIQNAVTKGLNPDATMKDSGVDWLGEIPEHWEVKRVKNIFQLIIDPAARNNSHELLSIYTDIGVRPRKDLKEKGNKASTTDGYWKVNKGDFIVNKLLAWMGAIGISEYEGVTSPAYDILRASMPISGYFYHYLFRSKGFSTVMKRHSKGIMDMRLRLYFDKFGVIEVPYPNRKEQLEISEFIDRESEKIDAAITIKQNQITKLNEYKSTLVNAAVTGKIKVI